MIEFCKKHGKIYLDGLIIVVLIIVMASIICFPTLLATSLDNNWFLLLYFVYAPYLFGYLSK